MILTQLVNDSQTKFTQTLDLLIRKNVKLLIMCENQSELIDLYRAQMQKRESAIEIRGAPRNMFNETKGKELVS